MRLKKLLYIQYIWKQFLYIDLCNNVITILQFIDSNVFSDLKSVSFLLWLIYLLEDIQPRYHTLRKYLSLKLDYRYLELYLMF